ncbi:oxygenase [Spiractinospora alimapuensis]|uniref:styrene monooxygenase/indole monooxygenase family protein n=1 Tax=Spiractinospora alimapuensis TaxID=2820884 RepID=UPI001F3515A1|nr:styrene monooxygenase/indole monooxygenase family protein [Spiractinospora alimapuensis]QVQ51084.1 oxygenase [Spiractinospora alimapuensis]
MRKILVVGAGYSGLTLAHKLLAAGHEVTMMTARSSGELRAGRPAPLAITFPEVYSMERQDSLFFHHWGDPTELPGAHLSVRPLSGPEIAFGGHSNDGAGVAVDNRLKMSDWLEYFEDRGGRVVITGATVGDLQYFTRMYDLVVVAVGGGELGELFHDDPHRESGAAPVVVTQATVFDYEDPVDDRNQFGVESVSLQDSGNVYSAPQLTAHGAAFCVCVTAHPGEPLDCRSELSRHASSQEIWDVMRQRFATHLPDLAERAANATLADRNAAISVEVKPRVRNPVGRLPGGGWVLGLADVVVSTDPRSLQGVGNSVMCSQAYFDAIQSVPEGEAFTPEWGKAAFETFWEQQGQHAATFSEMVTGFWSGALPPHLKGDLVPLLKQSPELCDLWITGWGNPKTYDWMWDPERFAATIGKFTS